MKLDLRDLQTRHEFWKYEIGRAGIWHPSLFLPVSISIRKSHRRYNGLFQRKIQHKGNIETVSDKIVIYRNFNDFDEDFINSVLVHEMIHQYIIQNKIIDSSSHGKIFKQYMHNINNAFEGRLEIKLKDHNDKIPESAPGNIQHNLLIIEKGEEVFCCVIHPSMIAEFDKKARQGIKKKWFTNYSWHTSNNLYFNRFIRCMRRLHGEKINKDNLEQFRLRYAISEGDKKPL